MSIFIIYSLALQDVVWEPAASVSPGSKMYTLASHPRPRCTETEPAFWHDAQVGTFKFEMQTKGAWCQALAPIILISVCLW